MYLNPIPQPIVLLLIAVFVVLGFFAGRAHVDCDTNDLNGDGEVTLQDFSMALYRVESIQDELRNYPPSN